MIVGAGVVGLAAAWRTQRAGLRTVVVERAHAGAGASGVAAGMLAPVTEADFGEDAALALNLAGRERWPAFAAKLSERSGLDTGYRESGALTVAADRDDAEELRRLVELGRALGLDARPVGARECRRLEPGLSPRVRGGIEAPHEAHVNPGATVAALRHAFVAEGGELLEGTAVAGVDVGRGGRVDGATLAGGRRLACETLVVAAGAWSPALVGLPPETLPPVRPVKGQILTLRARPEAAPLAQRLVRTPRCYAVSRPGGQTVVGATSEERGFDVRVTAEGVFRLLEAAREVLPDVDELELVEARAGLRPVTPDNAPVVGRTPEVEGLVWATGHGRNGVLLAPITADAVAALARGEQVPEPLERFGLERFGKRVRTPAAVAAA
ncbi:MAG TPA: glycine oxidase ThiO [Thermoleophilaceae bacterium]|nr:glycine oxidase ThiO [Thermoleophilaceae bacterium]